MLKLHPRTPAHLFVDHTAYFVSGAIYKRRPLLAQPKIKHHLLSLVEETFELYAWQLHHWVILDNHYHILGQSRKGHDLSNIFRQIHSKAAIFIREKTNCEKPVWWNYWDYCPRDEADYLARLNYLLNNPLKHGYVTNLQDYAYSSFHQLFKEIGREKLEQQFRNYPGYKTLVLREAYNDDF